MVQIFDIIHIMRNTQAGQNGPRPWPVQPRRTCGLPCQPSRGPALRRAPMPPTPASYTGGHHKNILQFFVKVL